MEKEQNAQKLNNNRYLMKDWFIGCCEAYSDENLRNNSFVNNLDMFFEGGCYIWVVAVFDSNVVCNPVGQFEMFVKIKDALKKYNAESFFEKDSFSFFMQFNANERQTVETAHVVSELIRDVLNKNNAPDYGIGIGRASKDITKVREAYVLAVEASKYRYVDGSGHIAYIGDVEPDMRVNDYHTLREPDFRTSIKIGNEKMNSQVISDIFGRVRKNNDSLDFVKRVSLELLVSANRAIYELGKNPSMLFDKTDIWSVINRCSDIDQIEELIQNTSQLVIMRIFQKQTPKDKTIVEKAKRIIDEDTSFKLSLELVAQKIYISPCYLSTVFSRETGTTFKEYLINSRISRAKRLLHDPAVKVYNVAKAVGYGDARYFSDLFKKRVGMTPAEYRKNLLQKN